MFFQQMGDFTNTVSFQIQRVINEAINDQILPQIQATLRSGQGQVPERRQEIPARRQGFSSEEALNSRFRSSSRDECNRDSNINEVLNNTCDNFVGHCDKKIQFIFQRKFFSLQSNICDIDVTNFQHKRLSYNGKKIILEKILRDV